jgi:hypothetical protein
MIQDKKTPQVTAESLLSQIKSIEVQLAVLKAQVKRLCPTMPPQTFADLYGILAGQVESTEEDINAVLYQFEWEDEDPQETLE